jgi:hypothetical protein
MIWKCHLSKVSKPSNTSNKSQPNQKLSGKRDKEQR